MFFRRPAKNPNVKDENNGVYRVRVKTSRHGDVVELRFTRAAHIGIDDDGNYVYRKPILSSQNLDKGEVMVQFDKRYNVLKTEAEGATFIPVAEWEE
ncbi:hypothetical protein [Deinococcus ruber]|uniref:Uncharacterized protein n=1 Tax=Deinococcus ruber TaxID=1848197 RepID=A0A918CKJ1_9DEIO|nr:hypothetical protein [Deinococcus ruber]GGR27982.1 hypothetical protein GCM10008957_44070 [Deinococcus ruber]